MALYLLTKGIGTGAMLVSALLWLLGVRTPLTTIWGPAIGLTFVTMTAAILIVDLERPGRFLYILFRPNWRSWMVWGAYFLTAFGAIATAWILFGWLGMTAVLTPLAVPAILVSICATSYTGLLFAQGLARDLWQGWQSSVDLLAQAIVEGAAAMLIAMAIWTPLRAGGGARHVIVALGAAMAAHLAILAVDHLRPSPTRHHELASHAISRGAFAPFFWGGAIFGGGVLPLLLIGAMSKVHALQTSSAAGVVAALALEGAFAWEYVWVEAGQSVPLS
jgi:formate-dependent nitrite reductase membrane component NrfD